MPPHVGCGCAAHPDRSGERPPSGSLEAFFEEGDSLYDATSYLCLSCHALWTETDDAVAGTHSWHRQTLDAFRDPAGWHLGMDDAWPGDAILADEASFVRWVRTLKAPVFSRGMV